MRTALVTTLALVLSAGGVLVRAHEATPPAASRSVIRRVPRRLQLSIGQAVRMAQQRFRARVVRAETRTQGGRTIYILRMLDGAGRVFAVRVDATSGAIL